MALSYWDEEEEEEEEFDDTGDQFNKDMDALRRACQLTGEDQAGVEKFCGEDIDDDDNEEEEEEEDDDDGQYLQSIQQKLMLASSEFRVPQRSEVALKPEEADVEEDDADILRAIRNRFTGIAPSFYGSLDNENKGDYPTEQFEDFSRTATSHKDILFPEEAGSRDLEQTLQEECADSKAIVLHSEIFDDRISEMSLDGSIDGKPAEMPLNDSIDVIGSKSSNAVTVPFKYAGIPEYARALIEALKKNRLLQKVMRSKLVQIETKIEENKDLMKRVKCLVDFQTSCKRRLTQLLAQDSDPSVKLISCSKARVYSRKVAENRTVHKSCGPPENPDVAKYRMVQKNFPTTAEGNKWSNKEKIDLGNGIKQQVQQTLVRQAMELLNSQGNLEDASFLDEQISAISQKEITPEDVRSFLPEVDWQCLASMYVPGRSGVDCEARWLNDVDPLINHGPWTKDEDKKLLIVIQHNGFHNWIHISNMLGTNRTPAQCLSRYQRSLNAHIMRKEWMLDEDEQLRGLVETFGENDWQIIAANMEGRTGAQCLNRWCKSINPDRKKVGRWKVEEDKRLKLAVMVYGPRTWKKIATLIPGRTEVQCRERWCNVLDPSLNLDAWTEEEDIKLKEAISLYGYCWAKVALFVPPRTDNQCRRRWKALHPEELAAAQKAGKIRKAALISNFVGRKKERPTIGPGDFLQEEDRVSNSEAMITSANEDGKKEPCGLSGKKRRRPQCVKDKNTGSSVVKRKRTNRTVRQKEHIKPSEASEHLVSKRTRKPMKAPMVSEGHHSVQEHNQRNIQVHSEGRPSDGTFVASAEGPGNIATDNVTSDGTFVASAEGAEASSSYLKSEKRAKGKRTKLVRIPRIINKEKHDTSLFASVQCGETPLDCTNSYQTVNGKQIKSTRKTMSLNQEKPEHGTAQLMMHSSVEHVNLNGLPVITVQGAGMLGSCGRPDKQVKMKRIKSIQKATLVNQEKNNQAKMQFVMPPVPNDNYCPTFSSDKFELGLNTQGQIDGISSGGNDKYGEDFVGCIKSNTGSNGKDIKSLHKSSSAEPGKGNQQREQLAMHSATVHDKLDIMPVINTKDAIAPSCCVKPDSKVKMSRSKSVRKSVSINQKRDGKESVHFITSAVHEGASLPLARPDPSSDRLDTFLDVEGKTNDVSIAFASMVEAIADHCRHDSHINVAKSSALPPEKEFDSFQVPNNNFQSCHATIEPAIGKGLGSDLQDSGHEPRTEAGIVGEDNETVALATKTILSWPFYFGLQMLGSKWKDTKDHCHGFEERLENTQEHRVDDQQTYGSISAGCTSNSERIENGQQRNLMLQDSNENGVLNKGKECEALADTENALNENMNEKIEEQAHGIQPRRSRRASRMNINYKEMLKGNFDPDLHKRCKNKGCGNS